MNSFFGTVLISAGDAARMSGFTRDELLRLVEAGVVSGRRFGESWFVSRHALEQYLTRGALSPELAVAEVSVNDSDPMRHTQPPWLKSIARTPLHEHIFALSVAAIVLFAGASVANTNLLQRAAVHAVALVSSFSAPAQGVRPAPSGMAAAAAVLPSHAPSGTPYAVQRRAATASMQYEIASPRSGSDGSLAVSTHMREKAVLDANAYVAQGAQRFARWRSFVAAAAVQFSSPQRALASVAAGYRALGRSFYEIAYVVPQYYLAGVRAAGVATFSAAVATRDTIAHAPYAAERALVAVGLETQALSHAAVRTDEHVAYWFAATGPAVSRAVAVAVGSTGDWLLQGAARAPRVAARSFWAVASIPASAGPAISHRAFAFEYGLASQFLGTVHEVLGSYAAGVQTAGVALRTGVLRTGAATGQAVATLQGSAYRAVRFSRAAFVRGATASAAVLIGFSRAGPVHP